jgi:hypothetical protein
VKIAFMGDIETMNSNRRYSDYILLYIIQDYNLTFYGTYYFCKINAGTIFLFQPGVQNYFFVQWSTYVILLKLRQKGRHFQFKMHNIQYSLDNVSKCQICQIKTRFLCSCHNLSNYFFIYISFGSNAMQT